MLVPFLWCVRGRIGGEVAICTLTQTLLFIDRDQVVAQSECALYATCMPDVPDVLCKMSIGALLWKNCSTKPKQNNNKTNHLNTLVTRMAQTGIVYSQPGSWPMNGNLGLHMAVVPWSSTAKTVWHWTTNILLSYGRIPKFWKSLLMLYWRAFL